MSKVSDLQGVTVFYDGGCPVCSREIAHYRRLPEARPINWVDISTETEKSLSPFGVTPVEVMEVFHVLDAHGIMQRGVAAFLALWQEIPRYRWLAVWIQRLRLQGFLSFLYRYFVLWHKRRRCQDEVCR